MGAIINTSTCKLRPFSAADAFVLSVKVNSKSIETYTTIELPWTMEFSTWWIQFISEQAKKKPLSEIHWVIEVENELVGAIGLINIEANEGELGYWLEERFWSQGIMTEVIAEVTKYGFNRLKLTRIFAPVLAFNKGSMRVLEKNGYEDEKIVPDYATKQGKSVGAHIYTKRNIK